jgi:hypothetical protein
MDISCMMIRHVKFISVFLLVHLGKYYKIYKQSLLRRNAVLSIGNFIKCRTVNPLYNILSNQPKFFH